MTLPRHRSPAALLAFALWVGAASVAPMPASAQSPAASGVTRNGATKLTVRSTVLPAQGLFVGDSLSAAARDRLDELIRDAADHDVEVAFIAPSGPWKTDSGEAGERSLTPARLQAVRDHLARRGVDGRRIYVENRIDPKAREARLTVELVGRPAPQ
jgi:hypothetical protein